MLGNPAIERLLGKELELEHVQTNLGSSSELVFDHLSFCESLELCFALDCSPVNKDVNITNLRWHVIPDEAES